MLMPSRAAGVRVVRCGGVTGGAQLTDKATHGHQWCAYALGHPVGQGLHRIGLRYRRRGMLPDALLQRLMGVGVCPRAAASSAHLCAPLRGTTQTEPRSSCWNLVALTHVMTALDIAIMRYHDAPPGIECPVTLHLRRPSLWYMRYAFLRHRTTAHLMRCVRRGGPPGTHRDSSRYPSGHRCRVPARALPLFSPPERCPGVPPPVCQGVPSSRLTVSLP